MASVQYETVVPIDRAVEKGVYSIEAARIHVSPVLAEIARLMRDIRATGKCGEFTAKWNGSAWELRRCDAPVIVRE